MPVYPPDQKIPNTKRKNMKTSTQKTPQGKSSEVSVPNSSGDLGITRLGAQDIPKMAKAATRTGDMISHHVGKVGSVMKKSGMLR